MLWQVVKKQPAAILCTTSQERKIGDENLFENGRNTKELREI